MNKQYEFSDIDKLLDETLSTRPGFTLPADFADKVTGKFIKRFAWKQCLKEFFVYSGLIVGFIGITVAMMVLLLHETWTIWMDTISSNIAIVIGISLIVLFILFTDKVLLKYAAHIGLSPR